MGLGWDSNTELSCCEAKRWSFETLCTCTDNIETEWVDILTSTLIENGKHQHPRAPLYRKASVHVCNLHNDSLTRMQLFLHQEVVSAHRIFKITPGALWIKTYENSQNKYSKPAVTCMSDKEAYYRILMGKYFRKWSYERPERIRETILWTLSHSLHGWVRGQWSGFCPGTSSVTFPFYYQNKYLV